MLERIIDAPPGIDALKGVGKLTKDDYEEIVQSLFGEARRQGRRIRFLIQLGPEYKGFTPDVVFQEAVDLPDLRLLDGYALVTDIGWIRQWTHLVGFLMPWPLRVFGNDERDEALEWLRSLPEGPGVSHRVLPDSKVLLVEVNKPLRTQDFDALALTVDTWLDTHHALPGIVIHTRRFPGWENVGGLLRHVRFVRDHHRKVNRVALAADSTLAALVPHLAQHFIHAEVKGFGYHELQAAIAWAANPASRGTDTLAARPACMEMR